MQVASVYDDDSAKWNQTLLGIPITGPIDRVPDSGYRLAVVGVGDARTRSALADRLDMDWVTIIHPRAHVDPSAELGCGTVVFAGAVVQPEARIGKHAIVNTGATVDHNCVVCDFVQIAPGANLSGVVTVGTGTFVGAGAVVIENVTLGEWSTVGAGSVVIRDLPDNVVAVGCPARVIKNGFPRDVHSGPRDVEPRQESPPEYGAADRDASPASETAGVRESTMAAINHLMTESGRAARTFRDQDTLTGTIGLDSLDLAAMVVRLEQRLGVDPFREGAPAVRTFGDLVRLYETAILAKNP